MPTINAEWRGPINNSLEDGTPCLLGTVSDDGQPQISPKDSVLVHNDTSLAYWERSKRTAFNNVSKNSRVVIYFWNPEKAEHLPQGASLRFFGTARVVASGPERDAVMEKVVERELKADPGREGAAVIVEVERHGPARQRTLRSAGNRVKLIR